MGIGDWRLGIGLSLVSDPLPNPLISARQAKASGLRPRAFFVNRCNRADLTHRQPLRNTKKIKGGSRGRIGHVTHQTPAMDGRDLPDRRGHGVGLPDRLPGSRRRNRARGRRAAAPVDHEAIPTRDLWRIIQDAGPLMIPIVGCSFLLVTFVPGAGDQPASRRG